VSAHLHINFGGHSCAGVKASNEDAFTAVLPKESSVRKYKGAVACVADGVSCSKNAQLASQTAVTNFASDYFNTPDFWTVKQSATKVIGAINSWLHQQGRQDLTRSDGLVTTFSAIVFKSHTAHIVHAGDSRIYLLRGGNLEQLTRDHSYGQSGENHLTRALGIEPGLDLDYRTLKVQLGDRFLLTTDGVHEHISHRHLTKLAGKPRGLEELGIEITDAATSAGSQDNLSCLIAEVESLPIERLEETYQDLSMLVIPPVLEAGNKIDHFEIVRILHSGTRSHVYLARDHQSDKLRVLKMPSLSFMDDFSYLESFAREQWIGRKLNHPKIVKILPPITGSKFLYHICEYIEGKSLRQWMIDNPCAPLEQVRQMLDEMIVPVRALHRDKMVHRDLKPENFMIDRDGRIKLIDLGTLQISGIKEISQSNFENIPVGDAGYIAPELLVHAGTANFSAASQSDLFSLANIVYEMLSGELPYNCVKSNRDYPSRYDKWRYQPLLNRSLGSDTTPLPKWIDSVLSKALAPRPNNRYTAMSEFQNDLRSPNPELLKASSQRPLLERNPLLFWQLASAILALVVLVQLYLLNR